MNTQDRFIVDAHTDLLMEVEYLSSEPNPFASSWLQPLRQGGVRLQVCPVFPSLHLLPEGALRACLQQAVACHQAVRDNPDHTMLIRTRDDLDALEASDRIGLMLSMEGVEPLGSSPELADVFWQLGVRMVSLTWNSRNAFADGLAERGGVTALGRDLVARLGSLGVIFDLVHASEATFQDVLELSGDAPVVVSHACCRAVCDRPRNLSDDQLRALADRGGILGMMALPSVVDAYDAENWTLDRLVDHVDHAVDVMGIEHVGLGGDFVHQISLCPGIRVPTSAQALHPGGLAADSYLEELPGPEAYPRLVEVLERRGYEGERLDAILGGNFMRLFRAALPST